MPIGFVVNKNIANWQADDQNPFVTQSNWFEMATGEPDVFKEITIKCNNNEALKSVENGKYIFEKSKIGNELSFKFETIESQHLFVYAYSKDYTSCELMGKGVYFDHFGINDCGNIRNGEECKITFSSMSFKTDNDMVEVYLKCYAVNDEVLNRGYEKLKQSPLEITSFNETNIKGTVNAKENGVMWTSIPYDKGWSVMVDGKPVETIAVQDAYLCFDMPAGEHTVEVAFTQPGLKEGICISIVSLLLCTAYVVILKKKQN